MAENKKNEMVEETKVVSNGNGLSSLNDEFLSFEEDMVEDIDFKEYSINGNFNGARLLPEGVQLQALFKEGSETVKKTVKLNKSMTEKEVLEILFKDIELVGVKGYETDNGTTFSAEDFTITNNTKKSKKDAFFNSNVFTILEDAELEIKEYERKEVVKGKTVVKKSYRYFISCQIIDGLDIKLFKIELKLTDKELKFLGSKISADTLFNVKINGLSRTMNGSYFTNVFPTFL